ncbi:mRNA splicing factor RNA helicase protein [Rutstroemia sp. NJR-2017a BVV2]|nr:mRNA splicing factor RNA helicase protein [Rutstroemia sp. NJR-2017a BVV2]
MTSPIPPPNPDPIPLFRPSKKRKIYRQRTDADADTETHPEPSSTPKPTQQSLDELIASVNPAAESASPDADGEEIDISSVLRLRKQRKKIGGVGFTAERTGAHSAEEAGEEGALVRIEDGEGAGTEVETEGGMRRFAPQMGVLGNAAVDKHITSTTTPLEGQLVCIRGCVTNGERMAYIEGKLARQNPGSKSLSGAQDINPSTQTQSTTSTNASKPKEIVRAPTTNGQLLEIDLGEEARRRNMERTEMARRRAQGEVLEGVDEEGGDPKKKARLGKDGKPRRWRKRRGSDDVQRDMLVEEILRENRLDLYEPAPSSVLPDNPTNNDDTLADLFRKDWEDAASFTAAQRQQQQAAAAAKKNKSGGGAADKAKTEEEMYMKGPKLGGSRSARAAMREMMLAKKKKF